MRAERFLQMCILVFYALVTTQLLYSGALFRYVGMSHVVFVWISCLLLWVMVVGAGVLVLRNKALYEPDEHLWMKGLLYAVLAFPAVTYLISLA